MTKIKNKNIDNLKRKNQNKRFRHVGKKMAIGVLSATFSMTATNSILSNAEYKDGLDKAINNKYVAEAIQGGKNKKELVIQAYEDAIRKNPKISAEDKEELIDAFTNYILDWFGDYFPNETIINMYAVAYTQNVKKMNRFLTDHAWWTGDYNSFFNSISYINNADYEIISHEQLHAILKKGNGTGFSNFFCHGYGLNEGMDEALNMGDCYIYEANYATTLALMLGYEKVIDYYLTSNLKGLKIEMEKYLNAFETNQLIILLDLCVYTEYLETFLIKNNIPYNQTIFVDFYHKIDGEINELLEKLFEAKYHCKPTENNFGHLLFNSDRNRFYNNASIDSYPYFQYYIGFYDYHNVIIITDFVHNENSKDIKEMYIRGISSLEDFNIEQIKQNLIENNKPKKH